ncbi:hypothetical protein Cgig2_019463 [Carnegiea gigantea]|uniref:Uncharacterized protein n=1 Tax=Carnegiea gigantea TaxID=171969 RepID=A0A9Q1KPT2_9CARY|nr:hypothetical protein Cgig2_019463 [Carnegiea gigantea]
MSPKRKGASICTGSAQIAASKLLGLTRKLGLQNRPGTQRSSEPRQHHAALSPPQLAELRTSTALAAAAPPPPFRRRLGGHRKGFRGADAGDGAVQLPLIFRRVLRPLRSPLPLTSRHPLPHLAFLLRRPSQQNSVSFQLLEMSVEELIAQGNSHISTRKDAAMEFVGKAFKIRLGRGLYGECLGVRADGNPDLSDEIGRELSLRSAAAGLRPIGAVIFMQRKNLKMCLRSTNDSTDTSEIAKVLFCTICFSLLLVAVNIWMLLRP